MIIEYGKQQHHGYRSEKFHTSRLIYCNNIKSELENVPVNLEINTGLLMAMAFLNGKNEGGKIEKTDTTSRLSIIIDHLIKDQKVLVERPELVQLGKLVDCKKNF